MRCRFYVAVLLLFIFEEYNCLQPSDRYRDVENLEENNYDVALKRTRRRAADAQSEEVEETDKSEETDKEAEDEDDDNNEKEGGKSSVYDFLYKRMKQEAVPKRVRKRPVPNVYMIPGPQEPLPGRSHIGDYWPVFPFQNQFSGGLDLDPSISRHIGGDFNLAVPSWGMLDIYGRFFNRIRDTTTKFGYLNYPVNMMDLEKEDFVKLMSDPSLQWNRNNQPRLPLGKLAKSYVPLNCKPPMCNPYHANFGFGMEHDYGGNDGVEGDIDVPIPISKGIAYRLPFSGKVYYALENITVTYGQNLAPVDPFKSLFEYQKYRDPALRIPRAKRDVSFSQKVWQSEPQTATFEDHLKSGGAGKTGIFRSKMSSPTSSKYDKIDISQLEIVEIPPYILQYPPKQQRAMIRQMFYKRRPNKNISKAWRALTKSVQRKIAKKVLEPEYEEHFLKCEGTVRPSGVEKEFHLYWDKSRRYAILETVAFPLFVVDVCSGTFSAYQCDDDPSRLDDFEEMIMYWLCDDKIVLVEYQQDKIIRHLYALDHKEKTAKHVITTEERCGIQVDVGSLDQTDNDYFFVVGETCDTFQLCHPDPRKPTIFKNIFSVDIDAIMEQYFENDEAIIPLPFCIDNKLIFIVNKRCGDITDEDDKRCTLRRLLIFDVANIMSRRAEGSHEPVHIDAGDVDCWSLTTLDTAGQDYVFHGISNVFQDAQSLILAPPEIVDVDTGCANADILIIDIASGATIKRKLRVKLGSSVCIHPLGRMEEWFWDDESCTLSWKYLMSLPQKEVPSLWDLCREAVMKNRHLYENLADFADAGILVPRTQF